MAYVRSNLDEVVAGLPGVNATVEQAAEKAAARMRAKIAPHIKTGQLFRSVQVERANSKDYWIHVSVPYVVPANYGFRHHWAHRHITGIHFIKFAVYGG